MEDAEIFRKEYGPTDNAMTPILITFGQVRPCIVYEFSKGFYIDHRPIWGITFVLISKRTGNTKRLASLSQVFFSKEEAVKFIESLK